MFSIARRCLNRISRRSFAVALALVAAWVGWWIWPPPPEQRINSPLDENLAEANFTADGRTLAFIPTRNRTNSRTRRHFDVPHIHCPKS